MRRRKGLLDEEKFLPPLPEQLPRGVSSLPGYGQTSPIAQGLLGFTGRQPTYSVMDPEAQKMSEAYRLGEQASVASQLYGSVAPFAVASAMANAQRAGSLLSPLTVFHGSPHKFSKFDASKIGTGEGAQVYGHGLYFAESPNVASTYASMRSPMPRLYKDGKPFEAKSHAEMLAEARALGAGSIDEAIERQTSKLQGSKKNEQGVVLLEETGRSIEEERRILDALRTFKAEGYQPGAGGHLYTVDIPDEQIAKMLDWDKPLSQQSRAIQKFALENSKPLAKLVKFQQANKLNENPPKSIYDLSGGELMRELGSPQEVAQKLRDSGIPGVRYLDQGSRGANKGTSNFVVFPGEESKVRIMEINGKPVVIDEEELRRSGLLGVAQ